jgi:hypothetical protein
MATVARVDMMYAIFMEGNLGGEGVGSSSYVGNLF